MVTFFIFFNGIFTCLLRKNIPSHKSTYSSLINLFSRFPLEDNERSATKANLTTVDVVNCDSFKRFWVSWANGLIKLGQGQLQENTLLFWSNEKPFTVRALSLKTSVGSGAVAEWQFSARAGIAIQGQIKRLSNQITN